jgi:hypothetical protein
LGETHPIYFVRDGAATEAATLTLDLANDRFEIVE